MTCRELVEFLMDYLDGALAAHTRATFEAHLGECPDCLAYVRSYRESVRLGKAAFDADDDPVPDDVPAELVQAILDAAPRSTKS